jgi:hypothetical protein
MLSGLKKYWKRILVWLVALDIIVYGGGSVAVALWYIYTHFFIDG